jgi:hypothetical protein
MLKVHFVTNQTAGAEAAARRLHERYGQARIEDADVVVALGGDGLMLQTLHAVMELGIPVYGMNFGSVGFMMNGFAEDDLLQKLEAALKADPNHARTWSYYGMWQAEQGNRLKAEDFLQKVKLICGNETCTEFTQLRQVIDGKASY